MRFQVLRLLCLACSTLIGFSSCSNNTNTALNASNIEQILVVDRADVQFSSQRHAPPPPTQLVSARYYGDHLMVHPVEQLPPWLQMEVTKNNKQKLTLLQFSIQNTKLESGERDATIRLVVYRNSAFSRKPIGYKDITVSYVVHDHFNVTEKKLEFRDIYGNTKILSQAVNLYGSGSQWQAEADSPWIQLSRTQGTGSAEIQVRVDLGHKQVHQGKQSGKVWIRDKFSDRRIEVPVTLLLEQPRLSASQKGVAFTQLYRKRRVEQTLRIRANTEKPIPWSALSNRKWLKITKSADGNTLALNANPRKLERGLHEATVTIFPEPPAKDKVYVKVGFYVNGGVRRPRPTVQLKQPHKDSDMISDPIRPYVYITAGRDVHRYNIYTGNKEILKGLGKNLVAITISDSGDFLYLADTAAGAVHVYDLRKDEVVKHWPGPWFKTNRDETSRPQLVYTSTNGTPVILTNTFYALSAESGDLLYRFVARNDAGDACCRTQLPYIEASRNGQSFYIQDRGETPALYRFAMTYSGIEGAEGLKIQQTGYVGSPQPPLDFAVSPDGEEVCIVTAGENVSHCYFGPTLSPSRFLKLAAQPTNVEFGRTGHIYTSFGDADSKPGIWRFNALTGKRGGSYPLSSHIIERQLLLSGDNMSIITLSNQGQTLSFLSTH